MDGMGKQEMFYVGCDKHLFLEVHGLILHNTLEFFLFKQLNIYFSLHNITHESILHNINIFYMNERACVALVGRTCKGDKSRHRCSFTNEGTMELNCGFEVHGLALLCASKINWSHNMSLHPFSNITLLNNY